MPPRLNFAPAVIFCLLARLAVCGLLSVVVTMGFALLLPRILNFDGPASDVPVIPDEAMSGFQRPLIGGALVTLVVSVAIGAAATAFVVRGASVLWMLAGIAAIANGAGALVFTAQPFVTGNDATEVIRGALPMWPLALAAVLWLAQVVMCLAAAIRSTPQHRI